MAEGDGSTRNFRSAYYEKLGFCGKEEKNILDLLITSSPFDVEKLGDLCERFDMDKRCIEAWKVLLGVECGRKNPFDEFANVRRVRADHFQSLKHHLQVLLRHNLVMKNRLEKCSKIEPKKVVNKYKHSSENSVPQESQKDTSDEENNVSKEGYTMASKNGVTNYDLEEENPARQIVLMYLLEAGRLESSDIEAQLESPYARKLSAMALFFVHVSRDPQEAFFLFRNFTRRLEENEALTAKPQINPNET